jgi:hypothetical protein
MRSLDRLEQWIAGRVRNFSSKATGAPQAKALLEIRRDLLNDIKTKIEPKGRGEYVFPFASVHVGIPARDSEHRELCEAAFVEDDSLADDIKNLLAEAGCNTRELEVSVTVQEDAAAALKDPPFEVEYFRKKKTPKPPASSRPAAKLTVLRGTAHNAEYVINSDRINIGRLEEVVSDSGGLIRRNDLAFTDSERTVAREHAYIRYDAAAGKFRLCDHLSGDRGTRLFRDGRSIMVPRASDRGVQINSGDEIHLGTARVRFEILP